MRRTWMYSLLCIAAGGLLLLTTAPVNAQEKGWRMGPPSGDGQMEKEMAEGEKTAGMTDEQRAKMKAMREEFRAKQKPIFEQIKAKREALRQELDGATPDRAKAETLAREINSLQGQAAANRIDEVFKVRANLTPEQYQKLREFRDKNKGKFREMMKERMKNRMDDGSGMRGPWHDRGGMAGEGEDVK